MNSTFRALLIGADFYFPNEFNGASYRSLSGCALDVSRIKAVLEQRVLGPCDITCLTAPPTTAKAPGTPRDTWPTAANIRKALADLLARVVHGDQVFLHYSGHGGRVRTTLPGLKGARGVDEALVPIDIGSDDIASTAGTDPVRYIRDHELGGYLFALEQKGALVTLLFDSCHSGGASRDAADVAVRCATGGDTLDDTAASVLPEVEATASQRAWEQLVGSGNLRAGRKTLWLPESTSYVLLAACTATESALEVTVDGQRTGVLTHAVIEALSLLDGEPSWRTVYELVFARVHSRYARQTPQLVGEEGRTVFGVTLKSLPRRVVVQELIDPKTVRLGAGESTGITKGAQFAIFPLGTEDLTDDTKRVALAEVISADATTARAVLDETSDSSQIRQGSPALALSLALRRTVEYRAPAEAPSAGVRTALDEVAGGVQLLRSALLEPWQQDMNTPDYVVTVDDGAFVIRDGGGTVFPEIGEMPVATPGAATKVAERLQKLARFHSAFELHATSASLEKDVKVSLLQGPKDFDPRAGKKSAERGGTAMSLDGDAYTVSPNTFLFVRVQNDSATSINVVVLDLQSDWAIVQVAPDPRLGSYEVIGPRASHTFVIDMYLPDDKQSSLDLLKVFVLKGHCDFEWLTQGPVDTAAKQRSKMRKARGKLEQFFDALDAPPRNVGKWRHARPSSDAGSDWMVKQYPVRVRRPE